MDHDLNPDLLPIGRFARLTGLTIGALRHYDEAGVLAPADVDPSTGYRRYRLDQVATARAIAALRDLELSLPAIRALLDADDAAARGAVLRDERVRLEARTARLQRALHRLGSLAASTAPPSPETGSSPTAAPPAGPPAPASPLALARNPSLEDLAVPTPPPPPDLEPVTHRALGAGLFNRTWDLLEIEGRTALQDDDLVDTAHASAWHWRQVGNAANAARGHWLCSRAYAVLGRGEAAVHHARRANEIIAAGGDGIEDWDAAAAAEAMARALAVNGDRAGAVEWKARSTALLDGIVDAEDRDVVERDLATLPV